jgi:hypothetical protein
MLSLPRATPLCPLLACAVLETQPVSLRTYPVHVEDGRGPALQAAGGAQLDGPGFGVHDQEGHKEEVRFHAELRQCSHKAGGRLNDALAPLVE